MIHRFEDYSEYVMVQAVPNGGVTLAKWCPSGTPNPRPRDRGPCSIHWARRGAHVTRRRRATTGQEYMGPTVVA